MSRAAPGLAPTPAQIAARLTVLMSEGLTVRLADLPRGAPSLQTTFGFGAEIWVTQTPDPADAVLDLRAAQVQAARLVVDAAGQPAGFVDAVRHGLAPYPRIPRS